MIVEFSLPDSFVPEEYEFKVYCAIKLLKEKAVSFDEALVIAELPKDSFEKVLSSFEKRYKKISGEPMPDWIFDEEAKKIAG
jgi:hypothetical protein